MDRAMDRAMDRTTDRPMDRTMDRTMDRAMDRAMDRTMDRTMDETTLQQASVLTSAGETPGAPRERREMNHSGLTNQALAAILEDGIRERHYLENRFHNLCRVILQLGSASHASHASLGEERDGSNGENRRKPSGVMTTSRSRSDNDVGEGQVTSSFNAASYTGPRLASPRQTARASPTRREVALQVNERLDKKLQDDGGRGSRSVSIENRWKAAATTEASSRGSLERERSVERSCLRTPKALASCACVSGLKGKPEGTIDTQGAESTREKGKSFRDQESFDTKRGQRGENEDEARQRSPARVFTSGESDARGLGLSSGRRVRRRAKRQLVEKCSSPTTTSCQSSPCHFEERRNPSSILETLNLRGRGTSADGLERERAASRAWARGVTFKAKNVQDLEVRLDAESVFVLDSDSESAIWRCTEGTNRRRVDASTSGRRIRNRRRGNGYTGDDAVKEARRDDCLTSNATVEQERSHAVTPTVGVHVHLGKPKASSQEERGASVRAYDYRLGKTIPASSATEKLNGNLRGGEASGYPVAGFAQRDDERFTMGEPDGGGGMGTKDDAFCHRHGWDGTINGVVCDQRRASKTCEQGEDNDEEWRQRGRGLWATYVEPTSRAASAALREPYEFKHPETQDALTGRLRLQSGWPYHGLYARSLQANGLEPAYFRTSLCSISDRHCRYLTGFDAAVSGREAPSNSCRLNLDDSVIERDSRAGDPLAEACSRAPTQGLSDKLEAGRVRASFNSRAKLLGIEPPTPLRTEAAWMAKSGDSQYRLVEGSRGLLNSLCSSYNPPSAAIRAGQAEVRSGSYASGTGHGGRPSFPAMATTLMVTAADFWNNRRKQIGAGQPYERLRATRLAKTSNL